MSSKNLNIKKVKIGNTERYKFGKIEEVMDIPYLVEVQKNSYQTFITKGIRDVLRDFSPITDTDNLNRSDAREDNTDARVELYFLEKLQNLTVKPILNLVTGPAGCPRTPTNPPARNIY